MLRRLIISLLILSLNACFPITNQLWKKHAYVENFQGASLEKLGQVVLLGEHYNYVFRDEQKVFGQIQQLPALADLEFYLLKSYTYVKGKKFYGKIAVAVEASTVSNRQKQRLILLGFQQKKQYKGYYVFSSDITGQRIAKDEKEREIDLKMAGGVMTKIILKKPRIYKQAIQYLLTPITAASDIVLSPFYFFYYNHRG